MLMARDAREMQLPTASAGHDVPRVLCQILVDLVLAIVILSILRGAVGFDPERAITLV
jgi:hypothetical protein